MPEPTIDDWIPIFARRVNEHLNTPISNDAAIFVAIGKLTLAMLDEKYILPHEQKKLWHSFFDHLNVELERLSEVKRAIEKGRHVDNELLDHYIQTCAIPAYPQTCDNLDQLASFVLVVTAFTEWAHAEHPQFDETSIAAFITDFGELYIKEIRRFFASVGTPSIAIN